MPAVRVGALVADGFVVERTAITVEGVCADCVEYDAGLREGVERSAAPDRTGRRCPAASRAASWRPRSGRCCSPRRARGVVRIVYEEHGDAPALREHLRHRRRGGQAARGHLAAALALVRAYFAGDPAPPPCAVDWDAVDELSVSTLQAVQSIAAGEQRSYEGLRTDAGARARGLTLGANPLAIVVPCHRVTRGREITDAYVGGAERKHLLRQHERH